MDDKLSDAKRRVIKAKEHTEAFKVWWGSDHRPVYPEDASMQEDLALLTWLVASERRDAEVAELKALSRLLVGVINDGEGLGVVREGAKVIWLLRKYELLEE